MQDRVPLYPGRVKMIPVAGQTNTYDMTRADQPQQAGTPLNKAALLTDATAALYGLGTSATVNDVLASIPTKLKSMAYGVCSTAAATTAKTVSAAGFALSAGAQVTVTFTYAVPNGATLNVNGTGAKYMRWRGVNIVSGIIKAGDTAELVYTGSYWYLVAVDRALLGTVSFAAASWETIDIISRSGQASRFWSIGDTRQVVLSTGEAITVRVEDFNHDALTAGGKAGVTLGMTHCMKTARRMQDMANAAWSTCEMRRYMTTLLGQFPSDAQAVIKAVNKMTTAAGGYAGGSTSDTLWLFSTQEVGVNVPSGLDQGTLYPLFGDTTSRIRMRDGTAVVWWLRTPTTSTSSRNAFYAVTTAGLWSATTESTEAGVVIGFCV